MSSEMTGFKVLIARLKQAIVVFMALGVLIGYGWAMLIKFVLIAALVYVFGSSFAQSNEKWSVKTKIIVMLAAQGLFFGLWFIYLWISTKNTFADPNAAFFDGIRNLDPFLYNWVLFTSNSMTDTFLGTHIPLLSYLTTAAAFIAGTVCASMHLEYSVMEDKTETFGGEYEYLEVTKTYRNGSLVGKSERKQTADNSVTLNDPDDFVLGWGLLFSAGFMFFPIQTFAFVMIKMLLRHAIYNPKKSFILKSIVGIVAILIVTFGLNTLRRTASTSDSRSLIVELPATQVATLAKNWEAWISEYAKNYTLKFKSSGDFSEFSRYSTVQKSTEGANQYFYYNLKGIPLISNGFVLLNNGEYWMEIVGGKTTIYIGKDKRKLTQGDESFEFYKNRLDALSLEDITKNISFYTEASFASVYSNTGKDDLVALVHSKNNFHDAGLDSKLMIPTDFYLSDGKVTMCRFFVHTKYYQGKFSYDTVKVTLPKDADSYTKG